MSERVGQNGFALISALLLVALVTSMTVAMATRLQLDITGAMDQSGYGQARQHLMAMEMWAMGVLEKDQLANDIDSEQDDWQAGLHNVSMDDGKISATISDFQGRFNLNNLAQTGDEGELARQRFERLLQTLGLNPALMQAVADWVDSDQTIRLPNGAEDGFYLSQTPAYRAANRPMVDISELRLVRGISAEIYSLLVPFVSALPLSTEININTAPVELLMSLANGISREIAQQLKDNSRHRPYAEIGEKAPSGQDDALEEFDKLVEGESGEQAKQTNAKNWTWSALKNQQTATKKQEINDVADSDTDPGLASVAEYGFVEEALLEDIEIDPEGLSVASQFFVVTGKVELQNGYDLRETTLLHRQSGLKVVAVMRRFGE